MRRTFVTILTLASIVGAGAALAAAPKNHETIGTVASIDAAHRTLVIDNGTVREAMELEAGAAILTEATGKSLTLEQLKVGERVKAEFTLVGSDRMVSKLEVLPAHEHARLTEPKPKK